MNENILALEASSPDELNAKIKVNLKNVKSPEARPCRYAAVAVSGPQVLVQLFELNNVPLKEVHTRVKMEAVELLGLPAGEVEFGYHIINKTPEKTSGVFACIPKKLLFAYLQVIDNAKLVPLKITPHILAATDTFLFQFKICADRFCFLDFTKPHVIHLAIFEQKRCELLREIPYENAEEAKREVIQSVRSACSKSSVKTSGDVYYSGTLNEEKDLMSQLEKEFSAKVEKGNFTKISASLSGKNNFFSINLLKNYTFSPDERNNILLAANVLLALFVIYSVFLIRQVKMNDILKTNIEQSYTAEQVIQAQELVKRVEALGK